MPPRKKDARACPRSNYSRVWRLPPSPLPAAPPPRLQSPARSSTAACFAGGWTGPGLWVPLLCWPPAVVWIQTVTYGFCEAIRTKILAKISGPRMSATRCARLTPVLKRADEGNRMAHNHEIYQRAIETKHVDGNEFLTSISQRLLNTWYVTVV